MTDAELTEWVDSVIAELAIPVELCACVRPVAVGEPDREYWCRCRACSKSVPMTDVVEGQAFIAKNIH